MKNPLSGFIFVQTEGLTKQDAKRLEGASVRDPILFFVVFQESM